MGLHQQFYDPKRPTSNYFPPSDEEKAAFQEKKKVRRQEMKVQAEMQRREIDRERQLLELKQDAEHNTIIKEANEREKEMLALMKDGVAPVPVEAEAPAETTLQDGILKREEAGLISPPEDEKRSRKRGTVKGK